MKVLFLCQRVPYPPDRGDRITTWHFLQHLLAGGASVRIGCFREEARDVDGVTFLAKRCEAIVAPQLNRGVRKLLSLRGLLTGEPMTLPFFRHNKLAATVARWVREDPPDLIYVYSSSMAQYVVAPTIADDFQGARVMQFAELDSDKWRQFALAKGWPLKWIYGREARKLLAFEREIAHAFSLSLVVSDVEKELFEARIPGVTPKVLPNGVDIEHFTSKGDAKRHPHAAVFTGVMDYEPNVDGVCWFAKQCWPRLIEQYPDAQLLIVGSKPTALVRSLAQQPGIIVTGRVPETPPYFDQASVAIAPLRLARGVQNKVLEAMSMSLPVVSSPQASQGLGDVPSGTLTVADGADATIRGVSELFADPTKAREMGQAAGTWVREQWRWERMYERFDEMLEELGVPT